MEFSKVIKQKSFVSDYHKALLNLWYTSNLVRDRQERIFKRYSIKSQHYNVLRIVRGQHPNPATPGYILEVMIDKGRDLTRLVDKMVKMGLLNRCTHEHNRRMVSITITDKGLDLVEEIQVKLDNMLAETQSLSDEEAVQLSDLLDKLRG
ncbi:MAG: winged helix DNA-binding protein [Saprospiraceae bacterium]|nr:winged helix DNA-binding protein [Saprospiraceae bacterium]